MQAPTPAANSAFRLTFEELLARAPAGTVRHHDFVRVPSNQKPWLDTGIDLAAGETVTTIGVGQTFLTGTPLSFDADFQLWYRIGADGEAFRGTRATNSFTVEKPGRLYVASYFPGEWSTRTGDLATPDEAYDGVTGDLDVLILNWQGKPLDGLKRLAVLGDIDDLLALEVDRLLNPVLPPKGWEYLWFIGPAETYRSCRTDKHDNAICCHSDNNAALLIKDAVLPLKPNTRLRWSWRMDELPSKMREDTLITHDYLSIAVEFDTARTSPTTGARSCRSAPASAVPSPLGPRARPTWWPAQDWKASANGSTRNATSIAIMARRSAVRSPPRSSVCG
jgi:Protein of unknown function (DUF3047)